jgi:hypothetical protein
LIRSQATAVFHEFPAAWRRTYYGFWNIGALMKPLTAVREYHYWSERLVAKLWQDNVAKLPDKINLSFGLSNLGIQTQPREPPQTRAARPKFPLISL